MKTTKSLILFALTCATALTATLSSHAQSATATISDTPTGGGSFDYVITLDNTSPTISLNAFWYGWTLSGNNLPSDPSSPGNSSGWVNTLDGNSIQWQNNSGTALAPGAKATFTFVSTSTPTQITTSPSGESVAYVSSIGINQGQSGVSTPAFSPVLVATPEPSSLAIFATGLFGLAAIGLRRMFKKVST